MVVDTSTIGQLPPRSNIFSDDIFEIQSNSGKAFHGTAQQIATFIEKTPLQFLKLSKVTTPSDPPIEEGIIYLREIDGTNNGLFIKIKKAGVITEVQLA